jgi:hypothetical protein
MLSSSRPPLTAMVNQGEQENRVFDPHIIGRKEALLGLFECRKNFSDLSILNSVPEFYY